MNRSCCRHGAGNVWCAPVQIIRRIFVQQLWAYDSRRSALDGGHMLRERALKLVLVLAGLVFLAGVYPLGLMFSRDPAVAMMMSIYVTLGIFLLLAAGNPAAHRSLILF